ncbi:phosphogluconate dehydrogenase (NAD(+)-dependent, decarboxylating) [Thermoproteota archaeon]
MEIGMIGLGRMGANMSERLMNVGHGVVGYARRPESVNRLLKKGIMGTYSLKELVQKLCSPRIIWLMIPAGKPVDTTLEMLLELLDEGDIVVDGGNSNYKDTLRRAAILKEKGIHFVDVGTSGGVWGLKEGYSMMVGGEKEVVEYLHPILETLAPAPDKGWNYVGSNGAGHFVKMVHNGIEYGIMEAYAEGFALLKSKEEFEFDLQSISEIWRYGSVIRSWILDLIANALQVDPELNNVMPYVEDSGEGRWTVFEAIDQNVATPVIILSLLQRINSRDKEKFSDRLLAVMREQFGGHKVKRKE